MAATTLKMSGAPFPKASKVTPYEKVCIKENNDKAVLTKEKNNETKVYSNKNVTSRHHYEKNWFTFGLFMQSTNELDKRMHFQKQLPEVLCKKRC